jgi:DNA-binding beta-propeller fold protein YncE
MKSRFLLAICSLLLLAAIPGTAQDSRPLAGHIFVTNQGDATISVISESSLEVVNTIALTDLGYSATSKPHHVAVDPTGEHFYVSLIGGNKVLKFNSSFEVVAAADMETPGMVMIDPVRDLLLVGRSLTAVSPPQSIGVINRTSMRVEEQDVLYPRPHALVPAPDGSYAYSASLAQNTMARINVEEEIVDLVQIDGPLQAIVQFAISPDGTTMVGGGQMTSQLLVFDLTGDMPEWIGSIRTESEPWHPVFSPDGRYVYFGNKAANRISFVDMEAMEVTRVISGYGIADPHGISISADGSRIYVSNMNMRGDYEPGMNHEGMDHEGMDHEGMDHEGMNHEGMNHEGMDHEGMDHEGMDHEGMNHEGMNHAGMDHGIGNLMVIDTASGEIVKIIDIGAGPSGVGIIPPNATR